jgi:protein-S-isoprenylcysteine O-methyltransferase
MHYLYGIELPPPLVALYFLTETFVLYFKRRDKHVESHDHGSYQMIILAVLLGLGLARLIWSAIPQAHLDVLHQLSIPAIALFFLGLGLRWHAIIRLGRFFTTSVAIVGAHQLIETGAYRFIRHPSYTGLLLMWLAIGMRTENILSLIALMLPTTAALLFRISIEEDTLSAEFGNRYIEYSRKTKRVIPFLY